MPTFSNLARSPVPTDRVFLAFRPGADAATHITWLAQKLSDELGLRRKPVELERLHVTLHHIGDYVGLPDDVVAAACEVAAGLEMPQFEISFDRVGTFRGRPGNLPLVLRGNDDVTVLMTRQRMLATAMTKAGLGRQSNLRTPHVTLLYCDRSIAERTVEAIRWTPSEFVLVHSLLGQTRHVVLGRWPVGR